MSDFEEHLKIKRQLEEAKEDFALEVSPQFWQEIIWYFDRVKQIKEHAPPEHWICACRGARPGKPVCPCHMRNVFEYEGRYIQLRDLGPVK